MFCLWTFLGPRGLRSVSFGSDAMKVIIFTIKCPFFYRNNEAKFREDLMNIARTTLSSKILTQYKDYFSKLAVDAVLRLKVKQSSNCWSFYHSWFCKCFGVGQLEGCCHCHKFSCNFLVKIPHHCRNLELFYYLIIVEILNCFKNCANEL